MNASVSPFPKELYCLWCASSTPGKFFISRVAIEGLPVETVGMATIYLY